MKILIVEDNYAERHALVRLLTQRGHECTHAWTGEGAIRAMCLDPPELVLLDLDLGPLSQLDGWDVLRRKMIIETVAKIPVFIVSGVPVDDARHKGERNPLDGAVLFFAKPFQIDKLLKAIEKLA